MNIFQVRQGERLNYRLNNAWHQPAGRLAEYDTPFSTAPICYRAIPRGRITNNWLGLHKRFDILKDTHPFKRLNEKSKRDARRRALLPPTHFFSGVTCCLPDASNWANQYFHWFFDILPKISAAEHFMATTGRPVKLIVPKRLLPWQESSLRLAGWGRSKQIRLDLAGPYTTIQAEIQLVTRGARGHVVSGAPYDAMSPMPVREIGDRLKTAVPLGSNETSIPKRIFISRKLARSRRIRNEDEIVALLSRYGFTALSLERFTFQDQVRLFRSATHVVAPHGAGLTNLLFSQNAKILEILADGHGVRPDYFQVASIRNADYYFLVRNSLSPENDIELDPSLVKAFLDMTL